jgi:hypothetical protein
MESGATAMDQIFKRNDQEPWSGSKSGRNAKGPGLIMVWGL